LNCSVNWADAGNVNAADSRNRYVFRFISEVSRVIKSCLFGRNLIGMNHERGIRFLFIGTNVKANLDGIGEGRCLVVRICQRM
jgi:hypothetical protein